MTAPRAVARRPRPARFSPRMWRALAVLAAAYVLLGAAAAAPGFNGLDLVAWVLFVPVFLAVVLRMPYYLGGGR